MYVKTLVSSHTNYWLGCGGSVFSPACVPISMSLLMTSSVLRNIETQDSVTILQVYLMATTFSYCNVFFSLLRNHVLSVCLALQMALNTTIPMNLCHHCYGAEASKNSKYEQKIQSASFHRAVWNNTPYCSHWIYPKLTWNPKLNSLRCKIAVDRTEFKALWLDGSC